MISFLKSVGLLLYSLVVRLDLFLVHTIFDIGGITARLPMFHPVGVEVALRQYGATIGNNLGLKPGLRIDNAGRAQKGFRNLFIGDNCYIGAEVLLDLANLIILEEQVVLSARVMILTHSDPGDRLMGKFFKRQSGPVRINRGSWLGAGAIVLHGITIGECAVVGAGSLVRENVPPYTIVAGVPARPIGQVQPTSTPFVSREG